MHTSIKRGQQYQQDGLEMTSWDTIPSNSRPQHDKLAEIIPEGGQSSIQKTDCYNQSNPMITYPDNISPNSSSLSSYASVFPAWAAPLLPSSLLSIPFLMRRRLRLSCSIWATWSCPRASLAFSRTSLKSFWAGPCQPPHGCTPAFELT